MSTGQRIRLTQHAAEELEGEKRQLRHPICNTSHQMSFGVKLVFGTALLVCLLIGNRVSAGDVLRCFKCTVTAEKYYIHNRTVTTPMCSKFDESDDYIVDCPYSTMCLKTISTLHLQNGQKQETITRGCAQQKNTTQKFRNRQWEQEHSVEEVYMEGCQEFKGNNLAVSVNTHCYCRGSLCNTASTPRMRHLLLSIEAMAVIFVCNFVRHCLRL